MCVTRHHVSYNPMRPTVFDRPPISWTIDDVSQFLLLNTVNLPYLTTVFLENRVDGAMLLRLSVDDLTSRFHLRAHDAVKLLDQVTRMAARHGQSRRQSLLPGESIIPGPGTVLPPPRLFQSAHVLPPADVAALQAQQHESNCAREATHYVPVLLPSDNPVGWRGSVYGEREDVTRKSGTVLGCLVPHG